MDSHIFVSGSFDGTVKLWSDNLPFQGHQGSVTSISLSPDLQKLVSSSLDGTVKLWKRDGSLIKSLTDPEQSVDPLLPVNSVSFSSKGNIIVAAGNDQFLRIWDGNGNFLKRKKTDQTAITKVIVNSNGEKIVSASQDKMIKLWNLTDNLPLYTLLHEDSVNDVSFNFDETELVSASSDGIIKIWNLNNGALVSQSQKQKSEFVNAIFSPNGKVVISIDEKGTLIIFERKGQLLKIRKSEIIKGNIINIGAIPDSNLFILIKDNGSIEIRDFQGNLLQSTSITHRKIQKNSNFLFNRLLVAMPNFQNSLDLWNLNTDDLINQNCQKLKKYFESQSINEKNEEEKHKTCSS
jgi:WD40 repeat protein